MNKKDFWGHLVPPAKIRAIVSVEMVMALWTLRHLSREGLLTGQCRDHEPCHMLILPSTLSMAQLITLSVLSDSSLDQLPPVNLDSLSLAVLLGVLR